MSLQLGLRQQFITLKILGMCLTVLCEERRGGGEIAGRNCSQSVRICDGQQILLGGWLGHKKKLKCEVQFGL